MQNVPREHSAILSTSIKLPFIFKTFVLSNFEWPFKTGLTIKFEENLSTMIMLEGDMTDRQSGTD